MATALSQTQVTDHRLGFKSLDEEVAVDRLPVSGELPAWLTGALVRVTPALSRSATGASRTGSTGWRC